jgi:exodeoxyribonuclease V gamma subunit
VGQRLLDARRAGADSRSAALAEIARGTLPPGQLGQPVIRGLLPTVDAIVAAAPAGEARLVDVRVALPDGRLASGTIPGVVGDVIAAATFSRLGPRDRLVAWVRLLALCVAGRRVEAVTVGRARSGDGVAVATIPALDADEALHHLTSLVDLFDRGMREPPPLYCKTSAAYAAAARDNRDATAAGEREWQSRFKFDGEAAEPEHQLVLGGELTFAELLDARPRDDERWDLDETRRFGRWARRLWDGLLAVEEIDER